MEPEGERLLSVFRGAGCPGVSSWTGSDLDWVYEIPGARDMLDRVTGTFDKDTMVLTEEELQEWKWIAENEPNEILDGELLDEALKVHTDAPLEDSCLK
jgi:hypothetical protein